MQITGLPHTGNFTGTDVLAIEINGVTYKLDGATLATAIASIGSLVTGVKGNNEGTYRTGNVNITPANIGAYSQAETDSAIQQSTAIMNFNFPNSADTWSEIYPYLSSIPINKSALFVCAQTTASTLSNGLLSFAVKGMVNRPLEGTFDFFAYSGYLTDRMWVWRISGLTSASATPTVGNVAVYRTAENYVPSALLSSAASAAHTFNAPSSSRHFVVFTGTGAEYFWVGYIYVTSTGTVSKIAQIIKGNNVSSVASSANNTLTFTLTASVAAKLYDVPIEGAKMTV